MAWNALATLKMSRRWMYTPPVDGAYFRLKHQGAPSTPRAWIAQAEQLEGNNYQLCDVQPLQAKAQTEILRLDTPPFFAQRRLALLQSDFAQNWSIQIEVNDLMPLTVGSIDVGQIDVSMPTSSSASPTSISASTTAVDLLAANSNRRGATILNNGTGNLFVELGATNATSTAYAVKLTPSSYFEVPFNFTGKITGIWDASGGNALIRELT